jgi:hypothetical protein
MRLHILVSAVLAGAAAAPAAAETPPAPAQPIQIPPEITDPKTLDQLANVTGVLSKSLLNLPIGEVEAAIENRPVTPADRTKTVRSEMGVDERTLDQDLERGKVAMKQGGQALVRALPTIMRSLSQVEAELARTIDNLPSPTYPKR